MKTAAIAFQMLVRVIGLFLIITGVIMWTGRAAGLVTLHTQVGFVLALSLLVLAVLAAIARVSLGLVAVAVAWAVILPVFGLAQARLLPGALHWMIEVLHLLVGLGAIGLAEQLGAGIKRTPAPALQSQP